MSRLPAPSKLTRPGGLVRPSLPPPSSRPSLPVDASAKKRPMPRGPPPNQANFHLHRSQEDAKSSASMQSAMSEVAHDFVVGNRVLVGGDRPGVIAFLGTTLFSRGEWAGVILDEPTGKNNGVVQGVQYFQCEPNHGVFARPQNLALEPPKQLPKLAAKPADKSRKFQVGDAVLVSGTKPGMIAFLGPTQFAKGEWAGVVMEKPEGKNNGSVQGVVYFQCPPQHGLFARLQNLTLIQPAGATTAPRPPAAMSTSSRTSVTRVTNAVPPSGSESTAASNLQEKLKELQVGDKVLVGGAKTGLLKYIGKTDFAKGIWAGIELDEAIGKNDGAVAGKRYFQCPAQHGLFAPLPRVEKIAVQQPTPQAKRSSTSHQSPLQNAVTPAEPAMTAIAPQQSPRGSFGVSPASSMNRGIQLRKTWSSSTIGSVMSESLINRQQEMEARGVPLEEQVQKLTQLLSESEQRLLEIHNAKEKTENEKEDLNQQVNELKRKLEELQFQMEEEAVKKTDQLKADSAASLARVVELEEQLSAAQQERDLVNEMLQLHKASAGDEATAKIAELEQQLLKQQSENEQLEQNLIDIKELLSKEQSKVTQLNEDLDHATSSSTELSHMIQQLQEQLVYNNEQLAASEEARSGLEQQLVSYEEELEAAKGSLHSEKESFKQQLSTRAQEVDVVVVELKGQVAELNEQLSQRTRSLENELASREQQDEELRAVTKERDNALANVADLESRLTSEEEKVTKLNSSVSQLKQRVEELLVSVQTEQERTRFAGEEKVKLEEQIRLLRSETGDSSQQLSFIELQLSDKERELNDVRNANSDLTMECTKLRGEVSAEKEHCSQEIEKIKTNYWSQVKELNATIDDLKAQVEETRLKYDRYKTQSRQDKEETAAKHKEVVDKLASDVDKLRSQLTQAESSQQEAQQQLEEAITANKLLETKITRSSDSSAETRKELEEERSKAAGAVKEQQQMKKLLEEKSVELKKNVLLNEELNNKVERLSLERESIMAEKNKLAMEQQTLVADKEALMTNLSSENKGVVEQRDSAVAERDQLQALHADLKKTCTKLEKEKASALEEKEKALTKVQEMSLKYDSTQLQLADTNENMEKVQNELYSVQEQREQERLTLQQKLDRSESHNAKLQRKLEKMNNETEYTLQESKSTYEVLEQTREINQKLEDQLKASGNEIEELEMKLASQEARLASVEASHSAELKAFQQRIEAAESSLTLKEAELNRAREKITELSELGSGSNEYINSSASSHEVALLEEEKLLLEERVKELTVSLEKALEQERRRSTDIAEDLELNTSGVSSRLQALQSQLLQVQVEKNEMIQKGKEADQQIEFLGTVIQDLQRKLEAAEVMAGLGPPPETMEEYQVESDEEITFNRQPAPRLFCDICDMFDDHDTDDCPLQAQTSESPLPSMHHGNRHAERPYCENCEMFDDHWTEDCQYDVTY